MANSSFHTTPRWTWHEVSPNLVEKRWGTNRPVGVRVGWWNRHAVQKAGGRDSKTQTMVNRQCWRGLWWNILFWQCLVIVEETNFWLRTYLVGSFNPQCISLSNKHFWPSFLNRSYTLILTFSVLSALNIYLYRINWFNYDWVMAIKWLLLSTTQDPATEASWLSIAPLLPNDGNWMKQRCSKHPLAWPLFHVWCSMM